MRVLSHKTEKVFDNVMIEKKLSLTSKHGINRSALSYVGFVTSKVACCGQGPYNGVGLCTVLSNLCPNRNLYAFWDAFHPTERANRLIVQQILRGNTNYMHPMNLSTIIELDSRV